MTWHQRLTMHRDRIDVAQVHDGMREIRLVGSISIHRQDQRTTCYRVDPDGLCLSLDEAIAELYERSGDNEPWT